MYSSYNTTSNSLMNSTDFPGVVCDFSDIWDSINYFRPIFLWIVFVLGFIENSFVLIILSLHKSRCTVAEIYLGNLAAADLLFVCGLPFWAIYFSYNYYWLFGGFLCAFLISLIRINLYGSVCFLTMVSFDRYLALVKTMSFGRMRRVRCAKFICVIIWVFAVTATLPKSIFQTVQYFPDRDIKLCNNEASDDMIIAINIMEVILGFLIPVAVISFCSFHIIKVLRNNSIAKLQKIKREKKATVLVLTVFLVFLICWLPFNIHVVVDTLDLFGLLPTCPAYDFLFISERLSECFYMSNSFINPLLYVMVGNNFRKKIKEVYQQFISR
ncbi:B2 bradykinin receptor-like [Rhinophrynus dorsalis]